MNSIRRPLDLDALTLLGGSHSPDGEFCVMEAVAYIAGEPWSDRPGCVSPVLAVFLRSFNDGVDEETRQLLKPYIPLLIGTAGDRGADERRAWMATDWLVRVCAPAFLDLAGLAEDAAAMRALPELVDRESALAAQPTIDRGRQLAVAARAAARVAAGDAVWAAAWDAAWAAARAAARDAARDAVWAAARAAAGDAAGDAVGDAARVAAGDAARVAAGAAAWAAVGDAAWAAAWAAARVAAGAAARAAAWDAAWDAAWAAAWAAAPDAARAAARAALQPTVATLQESAFELIDRMIDVGNCEKTVA